LVCHPDAINPKYFDAKSIGINYRFDKNDLFFDKIYSKKLYPLSENIIFLGQIPRHNKFEMLTAVGQTVDDSGEMPMKIASHRQGIILKHCPQIPSIHAIVPILQLRLAWRVLSRLTNSALG
ncbi:hypothetical protein ACUIZH_004831, partial [Klebsiella pneumoniae]